MKTMARLLAFLSVAASSLLYMRVRAPINPLNRNLWILRLLAGAVTPFTVLSAAVAAGLGLLARAPVAMLAGMLSAVSAARCSAGYSPAPRLWAGLWPCVGAGDSVRTSGRHTAAPLDLASARGARGTLAARRTLLDPSRLRPSPAL